VHRFGSCRQGSFAHRGRILLRLQHGPEWSETNRSQSHSEPMFKPACEGLLQLSATPERFQDLVEDVTLMQQTRPNYSTQDLANISVQVAIVQSGHDEFIKREHAEYLARSIPKARIYPFEKCKSLCTPAKASAI
jgi:hypothetical protein